MRPIFDPLRPDLHSEGTNKARRKYFSRDHKTTTAAALQLCDVVADGGGCETTAAAREQNSFEGTVMSEASTGSDGGNHATSIQTVDQAVVQHEAATADNETAALIDVLNSAGVPATDPVGAEVLAYSRGERNISPKLRAQVETKIIALIRNREFARRLLDGRHEEMRLLTIVSAILLAPIQEG